MNYSENFIKFYTKPLFLLLALFFWFNFFISSASAIEYGCLKTNGSCETVDVSAGSQLAAKCVQDYGQGTRAIFDGCNNFGCVGVTGVCVPITAVDRVEGQAKCDALDSVGDRLSLLPCDSRVTEFGCIKPDGACVSIRDVDYQSASRKCESTYGSDSYLQIDACGVEKNYPCFKGGESDCVLVKANTQYGASTVCKDRCAGTTISCYVDFQKKECPAMSGATEIERLQKDAFTNLNRSGISSPASLIRRLINLLMAFIGSITLVLYVFAGILWLTAGGASDNIDKAKKIMVWTTLGAAVMLFSYMLVSFLFTAIPK